MFPPCFFLKTNITLVAYYINSMCFATHLFHHPQTAFRNSALFVYKWEAKHVLLLYAGAMDTHTLIIASDIHGNNEALDLLITRIGEHQGQELYLAGDTGILYLHSFPLIPVPVTMVRGNCDSSYDFSETGRSLPPIIQKTTWDNRNIVMTHGDRYPSPFGFGLRKDDLFIFGHIHAFRLYRDQDDVIILNPGSTTLPRGGYPPSYAIVEQKAITIRNLITDQTLQTFDLRK